MATPKSSTASAADAASIAAQAAAELLKLSSSDSIYGKLENFQVEKKIGKGQFSVVWRAVCLKDARTVALKKVQIFEMMDAKARLDCMKEIQLLQVRIFEIYLYFSLQNSVANSLRLLTF